jgi:hypothetical protein
MLPILPASHNAKAESDPRGGPIVSLQAGLTKGTIQALAASHGGMRTENGSAPAAFRNDSRFEMHETIAAKERLCLKVGL